MTDLTPTERATLETSARATILECIKIKNALPAGNNRDRFEHKIDRAIRYLNNGLSASAALEASDIRTKLAEIDF